MRLFQYIVDSFFNSINYLQQQQKYKPVQPNDLYESTPYSEENEKLAPERLKHFSKYNQIVKYH